MSRNLKSERKSPDLKYRQVKVESLDKSRRGKHFYLVLGIVQELKTLPLSSAMKIPLREVRIGLANLRSAVHRASTSHGLEIATSTDENHFYVWRKAKL